MNKRQKAKKTKMRNKKLIKQYPFLQPRNVWTDKIRRDYNYQYTLYDDIPKGWRIGFGKFLLNDLKDVLIETNYLYNFRFTQIKEKYGTLRLYCNGAPEKVYDVLSNYEYISKYVCIQCGSPFANMVNDYGWYLPICENCWDKNIKHQKRGGHKTVPYYQSICEEYNGIPNSYITKRYSSANGDEEFTHNISGIVAKVLKKYNRSKKEKHK